MKFWELNNKLRSILNWIYLMRSRFCVLIYGQCKMMTIHVYLTLVSETVYDYIYKIYGKLCDIRYAHHNISPLSCDMQSDDLHHFVNHITNDCHTIEFPIKWSRPHGMTNMDSPFHSWYQSMADNKDIFHTKCPLRKACRRTNCSQLQCSIMICPICWYEIIRFLQFTKGDAITCLNKTQMWYICLYSGFNVKFNRSSTFH